MHAHPELELQDESCQRSPCWPTSQDLQSAFALNGDDDVHISVVDAQGVALAAVQGLNENSRLKMPNCGSTLLTVVR
jgi:hypothetical protein